MEKTYVQKIDPNATVSMVANSSGEIVYTGLTYRQHFAAVAMQGLIGQYTSAEAAAIAVDNADHLIAELNKAATHG